MAASTKYPSELVTSTELPTDRAGNTLQAVNHPQDHDQLAMEVIAIEAELGTNPKGNFPSVKARLDAPELLTFSRSGDLAVEPGSHRFYFPYAATILSVTTMVGTAPTGAAIICDVNKNGTTIFTTQGNRPQIVAAGHVSGDAVPDVTAIADGDYMTVDVDQIGSSIAGADLTVIVQIRR